MNNVTVQQVPDDAVILDVREDDEWAAGHAPNAVHIPLMQVPGRVDELPTVDGALPVVCRKGGRSAQAVAWLEQHGYDVVNVQGGMSAWDEAGKSIVADAGDAHIL